MITKQINQYDPISEQDSLRFVPLLFFILLSLSALLPHAHLFTLGCLGLLFLLLFRGRRWDLSSFSSPKVKFYCLFWCYSLSALLIFSSWRATLLSLFLRLSFFLPHLFPRIRKHIPDALATLGAILGALAITELLLGGGKTEYSDATLFGALPRAAGPFGNPNVLAAMLLPSAAMALGGALFSEPGRLRYALCFLLSLGGICATFSRGAILALGISALWLLWRRFGTARMLTGGCLLLPAVTLLLPRTLAARLRSLTLCDSSVFYRFSLWKSVFRVPPAPLLFGVGEGKEAMLALLSPHFAAGLSHVEHTHSLFLHLLVSSGLLGLLLFLLCLFAAFRTGKDRGSRAALLSLLIFGFFDDPLYSGQTEVILWLVLGLC